VQGFKNEKEIFGDKIKKVFLKNKGKICEKIGCKICDSFPRFVTHFWVGGFIGKLVVGW
jgi:hypothetical protein